MWTGVGFSLSGSQVLDLPGIPLRYRSSDGGTCRTVSVSGLNGGPGCLGGNGEEGCLGC